MSVFEAARPHNPTQAPGICLCIDCCRIVDKLRCSARDGQGHRCGTYRHRGNEHSLLVDTTFQIVDDRLGRVSP